MVAHAPAFHSRVVRNADAAVFERSGVLTSYSAEGILSDALHAGHGAQLHIDVPSSVADGDLEAIERLFAWLAIVRHIEVSVQRRRGLTALVERKDAGTGG